MPNSTNRPLSNDLSIVHYLHCGKCIAELPPGISPQMFAQLEVGFTPEGLQIWCRRHQANVMHIDFQGQKHPANTTAKK